MDIVVCLLIFVYINFLGWKFINGSRTFIWTFPCIGQTKILFSGPESFLLLTLGCAIIAAAPLGLLPIRLLLWILLLLLGIIKTKRYKLGIATMVYSLYLLTVLLSLFWSPTPFYGFCVFLKYLLPFFLLLFVPANIHNKNLFPCGIKSVTWALSAFFITYGIGVIGLGVLLYPIRGMWWWGPAIIDSYSIFSPLCIIGYKLFSEKKYFWMIGGMVISPLIGYVVRTGLVALFVSAVAMGVFYYKIKAIPFLIILVCVAFLSVVYIPQLRSKMFYEQYATEEYAQNYKDWNWNMVNSNGRFAMWGDCLQRYYSPSPWIGSGAGAEQNYLYQKKEAGWGAGICHCDYVQILSDNGLLGIILYGLSLIVLIVHSFFIYNDKKKHMYCRYSAFIAGTGMCGMAAAMMTDNVVNYTMCTLALPFTFYGMALGLQKFSPESMTESQTGVIKCSA